MGMKNKKVFGREVCGTAAHERRRDAKNTQRREGDNRSECTEGRADQREGCHIKDEEKETSTSSERGEGSLALRSIREAERPEGRQKGLRS